MKAKIEKILLVFILLLIPIFLFRGFLLPKIKDKALQVIKKGIEKRFDIIVLSQDIRINFWKGGVEFKESYIKKNTNKKNSYFTIEPIFVEGVGVDFSLLAFFYGKVKIRNIKINTPKIHLVWNDEGNNTLPPLSGLNLRPLFKISQNMGIRKISIQNADMYISRGEKRKNIPYFQKMKVTNINLILKKVGKKFDLSIDSKSLSTYFDKEKNPFVSNLSFNMNFFFSEKDIEIRSLHLSEIDKENCFINISGIFFNVNTLFKKKSMNLFSDMNWEADYLSRLNELLFNGKHFPLKGRIKLDTTIRVKDTKHNIAFKVNTEDFYISDYLFGNIYLFGSLDNKKVQLKKGHLHHPSGIIEFKKAELFFDKNLRINTVFNLKKFKLRTLLRSLKIKQIPLRIVAGGDFACHGDIYPQASVICTSKQIETEVLKIFSGKDESKPLVESNPIRISGKTTINSNAIKYQAVLKSDHGSAESTGIIDYKKGFYIDFKSSQFKFKQFLKRIANLKIEGSSEIVGYTKGTSDYAIVDIRSKTNNLWIEDYFLGNAEFNLKYKEGLLYFNNIKGEAFSTQYFGDIAIDTYRSLIEGKIESSHLELSDLHKILIRQMNFPEKLLGIVQAHINWSGPLDLNKIKGDLLIKGKRIQFLDEFFSNALFEVYWKNGIAYSKNIYLFKNTSILQAFGWINLKKQIELKLKGDDIDLYEFSMIHESFLSITGKMNLNIQVSGLLPKPNIFIEGQLKDISSSESYLGKSTIYISQTDQFFKLKAHMFDNQVYLDTQIPYKKNKKLYFIFNTSNWNFSNIFPLFHKEISSDEYESEITAKINLKSNSGKIQNIEGIAHLNKFLLKREDIWLKNIDPITISLKNGNIKDNVFHFRGNEDSFLKFESKKASISDLNLKLQLKSNLDLFLFLFPFLEDVGGSFFTDLSLKKDLLSPKLNGDINFDNIFFKIYSVKHLIENININAQIKDNNAIINSLSGLFSESPIQGKGKIEFKKIGDVPVNINLKLNASLLELPEDITTSGLIQIQLYGKWFPYNLKGIYNVSDGIISRGFNQNKNKYQSYFILKKSPYSFNIDMVITSKKGIRVQNSQFDGKIKGNFVVSGSIENPFLLNSIEIEPKSKIFFRDHFFTIDSGYVQFDDKEKNNPNIFINGSTEIRKYKISFTAKERANNPTVIFTSIPPISEKDIISLIVTDKTLKELEIDNTDKGEQILINSSYQIGASFITKKILKKQFNNELGLDIKVDSSLNEDTNVSEPRLILSRDIIKDLNIQASRSLGENIFNEVKIEYQMDKSMSAIGSWKGKESRNINSRGSDQQSILSLDLQYQIDFK